jgi:uncharacterized membrane protein YagU involved in acid resistance
MIEINPALLIKSPKKLITFLIHHLFFIILFAVIYYIVSEYNIYSFSIKLSPLDAVFFSTATQTTVGYGSIVPISNTARMITMIQLLSLAGIFSIHLL